MVECAFQEWQTEKEVSLYQYCLKLIYDYLEGFIIVQPNAIT